MVVAQPPAKHTGPIATWKRGMLCARAPLRVSFSGGGTDIPPFPEMEGGCVLSATINRYASTFLRERADGCGDITVSAPDGSHERISRDLVYDGRHDFVKAAIRGLCPEIDIGFDVFTTSDVAVGSGLGASSAVLVSMLWLLASWRGIRLPRNQVASMAYSIERGELKLIGGLQDQYSAAFGGFNFIEFDRSGVRVHRVPLPRNVIRQLECRLLLCSTGYSRAGQDVIRDQVAAYKRRDRRILSALRELKAITLEMKGALLAENIEDFGTLLHEEWLLKQRLSNRVTTPTIDVLYTIARQAGAAAGKIAGAGGGGHLLLMCLEGRTEPVAQALQQLGYATTPIRFDRRGVRMVGQDQRVMDAQRSSQPEPSLRCAP